MPPPKIPPLISDLALLRDPFREMAQHFVDDMRLEGLPIIVMETLRSAARQAYYFSKGTSRLKIGPHCYGLAIDPVLDPYHKAWAKLGGRPFRSIDGGGASWDTGYDVDAQGRAMLIRPHIAKVAWRIGYLAEKHGLEWGGRWSKPGYAEYPFGWDVFHVQLPGWDKVAAARGYKPAE